MNTASVHFKCTAAHQYAGSAGGCERKGFDLTPVLHRQVAAAERDRISVAVLQCRSASQHQVPFGQTDHVGGRDAFAVECDILQRQCPPARACLDQIPGVAGVADHLGVRILRGRERPRLRGRDHDRAAGDPDFSRSRQVAVFQDFRGAVERLDRVGRRLAVFCIVSGSGEVDAARISRQIIGLNRVGRTALYTQAAPLVFYAEIGERICPCDTSAGHHADRIHRRKRGGQQQAVLCSLRRRRGQLNRGGGRGFKADERLVFHLHARVNRKRSAREIDQGRPFRFRPHCRLHRRPESCSTGTAHGRCRS